MRSVIQGNLLKTSIIFWKTRQDLAFKMHLLYFTPTLKIVSYFGFDVLFRPLDDILPLCVNDNLQ